MSSIRLRLLLLFLGLILFAWAITAGSTYYQTSYEVEEIYDAHLAQAASELMALVYNRYADHPHESSPSSKKPRKFTRDVLELKRHLRGTEYAPQLAFRIWANGRLLFFSRDAHSDDPPGSDGFGNRSIEGNHWRVYTLHDNKYGYTVEVAEQYEIRQKIAGEVGLASIYPALISFPVIALLAWFAVGHGLRPLHLLAGHVRRRSPVSLQPVEVEVPQEVKSLVQALNGLLERLEQTLDRERHFTADASHELRTPLASLRVQAQVAARADSPERRKRALEQIIAGADRATHLIEQLLTVARLDPQLDDVRNDRVILNRVCADAIAQATPWAFKKDVELTLTAPRRDIEIPADASMTTVLLRNLIDNAVRYSPPGGRVEVRVREAAGAVYLEVADSGPGIAPNERNRVLDRFYRGLGTGEQGCGLGLSIVQRIAELHRAVLNLGESDLGGLAVTVGFNRI